MNTISPENNEVSLCAVGDVSFCGGIEKNIPLNNFNFPFSKVRHVFHDSNICIANLENVLTTASKGIGSQAHLLKSHPSSVESLLDAGFDIVSLANNHALDYGMAGIKETIKTLDNNHILHTGANENLPSSRIPAILKNNGISLDF